MRYSVLWVLMFFLLTTMVHAGDLRYYFNYSDTTNLVLAEYQKLSKECEKTRTTKCQDVVTHGQNFLLQKISAYQELASAVVGNYDSVFTGGLSQEAKQALAQHDSAIADTKYLVTAAPETKLADAEQTVNSVLKQNILAIEILNAKFHHYKIDNYAQDFKDMHRILKKEAKGAKSAGLDTVLVDKYLADAEKDFKEVEKLRARNDWLAKNKARSTFPEEVSTNLEKMYTKLTSADQNMLKSAEILQRFTAETYWE